MNSDAAGGRRRRILVIDPVGTDRWVESDSAYVRSRARAGTVIDFVPLEEGPLSLESAADEAGAVPGVVRRALELGPGHDGILVNCFLDPGVLALRELCGVPVVGAGEGGFTFAALLADRFSVLAVAENLVPRHRRQARLLGLEDRLASVESINVPVLALETDPPATVQAAAAAARRAVERHGAGAVVLGCTGLARLAEAVGERCGVPVVEPLAAALKLLETHIDLGLGTSRAGLYRRPEVAKVTGWGLPPAEGGRAGDGPPGGGPPRGGPAGGEVPSRCAKCS